MLQVVNCVQCFPCGQGEGVGGGEVQDLNGLLQRYLLTDMQCVLLLEGAMMSQTASGANVELLQSLKRVMQSSLWGVERSRKICMTV